MFDKLKNMWVSWKTSTGGVAILYNVIPQITEAIANKDWGRLSILLIETGVSIYLIFAKDSDVAVQEAVKKGVEFAKSVDEAVKRQANEIR